jgi:hypothetical protein
VGLGSDPQFLATLLKQRQLALDDADAATCLVEAVLASHDANVRYALPTD